VHRFFCIPSLVLASAMAVPAQNAPERAEPFLVAQAAKPPAATPEAAVPPATPQTVRLQFPNSDVVDVLRLYEQLTGKKLVMDNFVQGKVNIFIAKDVSRDEAIKIIEMSMGLNGVSLVPAGPGIVEVVGAGQNPRKAAVPIVSELTDIPVGNPVISFLFRLQYADPQELQQVLMAYLQGSSGTINILALPKSSSLLVTQNADVIRQLASVIEQVDVAPAEVVSEFIKLDRADATKVVDMLKDIFEKDSQQTSQPGVRSVKVPTSVPQPMPVGTEGRGQGVLSEEAVVVGKIKLTADVRTNRIHIVTRPINMPFIRRLIREFDANVEFGKPVTRYLRYISAGDVLPVLVQALTEPGVEAGAGTTGGAQPGQSPPGLQPPPRGGSGLPAPGGGSSSGYGSNSSGSTLNISEELSTQPVDTAPQAVTIGNTKLIADQRANTIIVLGNREVVVKVEKILDEMDVQAPQVALSTVIGQLQLSNDEEFGADYFAKYHNRFVGTSRNNEVFAGNDPNIPLPTGSPGGSIMDPNNLINFSRIIRNVGAGTNIYVAAGDAFASIVHLLETTGKFKIISRPTVFTSNNKKAIIASGQEVPVPVNTLTNATTVNNVAAVSSSIEYKKVALQLEVVPLINSEKEVSLDILQKIDALGNNRLVGGNLVPEINTRYIRTNVSARNKATIVLGGLIEDNKQRNSSGIPYLSRIPYVGALFRSTKETLIRQELIILMRPEVTLTKLDAYRLRQKQEDRTHFGPELDQDDCPDCPKVEKGKQLTLPPPDIPAAKDM